jgi:hypothetical protein
MMNITIRHKIYCPYLYSIREFCPKKKNYLYVYPQYAFVFDPFSSLVTRLTLSLPRRPNLAIFSSHVVGGGGRHPHQLPSRRSTPGRLLLAGREREEAAAVCVLSGRTRPAARRAGDQRWEGQETVTAAQL